MTRERRGVRRVGTIEADQLCFAYEGLDGVLRRTRIQCASVLTILPQTGPLSFSASDLKKKKNSF